MAINFPASPSTNDIFTEGSVTYKWDGAKWIGLGLTPADRLVEGSNNLEINSNNLVWTGNNVGIGETNPDQLIHINKASGTTLFKASTQANSTIGLEIEKTGATTQSWRIADGQTVNGKLEFYDVTDSATRMCIDGAGRILINRTSQHASSSERLSVNGMTSIQFNSTTTASLYIFNEDTTNDGSIQPFIYGSDGSGLRFGLGVQRNTGLTVLNGQFGLSFRTGASGVGGTEKLRISDAGEVTKPQQPLAIIGITDNNHTPASGSVIEWDYVQTNRGNHFDTTNHKFVCPVEGDYMVIFNHARTGWVGDLALEKAASGGGYTAIRRLELREVGRNNNGDADWQAGCYSYIIPCNAGDQLRWTVTNTYSNSNLGGAGALLDGYNHVYYDSATFYLMG
tara:strand:+ start:360 stop:1547 length:1188 start_codon:yes stop_codon:yes gene_type:complete